MKKITVFLITCLVLFSASIRAAEIKVAAVEFNPAEQNLQGNIDGIVAKVTTASQNGAKLIVLPEVAATGWIIASKKDSDTIPKITVFLITCLVLFSASIRAAEIKVAAVEFNPAEQNLQGNIDGIVAKVTTASQNGAKLIVLPEVAATGWIIASKKDSDTKSHLNDSERQWATAGNDLPVFSTNDLGRLAVMLNDEVRIPELTEVYALNRADLILIPAMYDGKSYGGQVNIPKALVPEASNRGVNIWYNIAKYSQAHTLVANYQPKGTNGFNASALYSMAPEIGYYPPNIAPNKEAAYQVSFTTHLQNNLWIDQQKWVVGRRYDLAAPLTLDTQDACFKEWQKDSTNKELCPKVASGK
jgi:hypothetical protein